MIYLDYNATAPLLPRVVEAMTAASLQPSNPSSVHALGRKARQLVEDSRDVVAKAVSAFSNEVIFTASGTEANTMALRSFADRPILVGATEHASIAKTAQRLGGDTLTVGVQGMIDGDGMARKLAALGRPAFVSVMLANNETGVIQPVAELVAIAKRYDALVHCDASQAIGKIPVDMGLLGVDMLTLCAHKAGGPVGVGALVVRQNLPVKPLLTGGGQELGRRAGTENVSAIVGFASLLQEPVPAWMTPVASWLRDMEAAIKEAAPDAIIAGEGAPRLGNTSCIMMPKVNSETQLMTFDLEGFAVSAGSACTSGRIEASAVLLAMGVGRELASGAVRISAGWNSSREEILRFTEAWKKAYMRLSHGHAQRA